MTTDDDNLIPIRIVNAVRGLRKFHGPDMPPKESLALIDELLTKVTDENLINHLNRGKEKIESYIKLIERERALAAEKEAHEDEKRRVLNMAALHLLADDIAAAFKRSAIPQ